MKLYLIEETEINGDESETNTYISQFSQRNSASVNYKVTTTPATIETVTLAQLARAVDSHLENANHHSMVGMGEWIADQMVNTVGEEKAKQIFWNMIQDKGLLWEF